MAFGRTKPGRQANATRRDGAGSLKGMTLIMSLLQGWPSALSGKKFTPDENAKVVAILKTLTGEQPNFRLPILPPSSDTTPRPIPFEKITGSRHRKGAAAPFFLLAFI